MEYTKKIALLADIFECETDELSPDLVLKEFEKWDSMARISLIVLIDEEFGKTLTSKEVLGYITLNDILEIME